MSATFLDFKLFLMTKMGLCPTSSRSGTKKFAGICQVRLPDAGAHGGADGDPDSAAHGLADARAYRRADGALGGSGEDPVPLQRRGRGGHHQRLRGSPEQVRPLKISVSV